MFPSSNRSRRKLVSHFTLLALLLVLLAFVPAQGLEVKVDLKGASISERTIRVVETVYQDLGGVYSLSLKGPGNPYYCGNGFLLYLNESSDLQFELEIHEAPSGFEINLDDVKVSWNCGWTRVELDVKETKLLKSPISIRPGQSYKATFTVKPYEKEVMPIGGVESCQINVRISGNATFGKNVKDFKWSSRKVSATICAMKPEDELQVVVEPDLGFAINNGRVVDVVAEAQVTVKNNLGSDLTLQYIELGVTQGSWTSLYEAWIYKKQEVGKIIRASGSETVSIREVGIPSFMEKRNGCLLLVLHYLTDEGPHEKRIIYTFDLAKIYSAISSGSTITHTSKSTATHIPMQERSSVSELGSMVSSLVIWIVLAALAFIVAGALFIAKKRASPAKEPHPPEGLDKMRAAVGGLPDVPPPPQVAPSYLKELYARYLVFKRLLRKGWFKHALFNLRQGLADALSQLAYSLDLEVDTTGIMPGNLSAEIGAYASLLLRVGAIDQDDFDKIRLVASLIGRCLEKGVLTSSELDQIARLYVRVYDSFRKKFKRKFGETPSYIG